jgi:predicted ATPase/DNA-binding SARP family transcriptional activator/Tfp pilus assembly protein PilF
MIPPWTILLLGGLRVEHEKRQITRFRTQKAASLLAYLALHPAPQPRETLIDLLWPDVEIETGRHNLSNALTFLRHLLEPPGVPPGTVLLADRASVRLSPAAVTSDVVEFERDLDRAEAAALSEAERLALLQQALERYQDPLLPGFYEEWIGSEALRLESRFVQGVVHLVPRLLAAGKREPALLYAQRAVSTDPLSEEATFCLMQALAASGQPGQALRAYRAFAKRLEEELDSQPSPALQRLAAQLGRSDPSRSAATAPQSAPPSQAEVALAPLRLHVPGRDEPVLDTPVVGSGSRGRLMGGEFLRRTTTRFFGREEEMARLDKMLSTPRTRLVTITGPGGTGKTRLALEVAAQLAEEAVWEERALWGAVFVSLAELSEAERLFEVMLRALGIVPIPGQEPLEQLAQALVSQSNTLLVLDNFEQLVEAGALLVRDLLAKTEKVKLLVTSRQKLNIEAEHAFHLAPLPLSAGAQTPEEQLSVASIALFVDRAQAALPDFQLTERNAAPVAQLCDYLEGLPLSIELAAARVSVLSPSRILSQVQAGRLDFLATRRRDAVSRQKTLRATLDWSYHLLSEAAQRFLAQVSVFRGGWTLLAAQAVCALSEEETLEMLTLLRDSSLLKVTDTHEGLRFSLLETIREYSQERLRELGEEADVCRRHRDYFAALVAQAEPELAGPEQALWLERLETEHDNLCAALGWCETDAASAQAHLLLTGALSRFWEVRGYLNLGRGYLSRALSRDECSAPTADRAKALQGAGSLANSQGDFASARVSLEESLTLRRELGDRRGIAASLFNLGLVAYAQGDYAAAKSLYEESLAIRRELGDKAGIAASLFNLGLVAYAQGDYAAAKSLYEESLAIRRELGDRRGIAVLLENLGLVVRSQGDYAAAKSLYEESLAIRRELGYRAGIAGSLDILGNMAFGQGDYAAAKSLYEESLAIRQELGDKVGIAGSLYNLGDMAFGQGDYEAARTLLQESLALFRQTGHSHLIHVLGLLGHVERAVGDYARAAALYQESLQLRREMDNVLFIALSMEDFAGLAARQGQSERAVRLLGAAEALCQTLVRTPPAGDAAEYERTVAAAHTALSEEAFASVWEQGRAMTLEQAVGYALERESVSAPP